MKCVSTGLVLAFLAACLTTVVQAQGAQSGWSVFQGAQNVTAANIPANTAIVAASRLEIYLVATDGTVQKSPLAATRADFNFQPFSLPGPVLDLSVGPNHGLAILAAGRRAIGWGNNQLGQVTIPEAATANVRKVAAGKAHSLALLLNGTVVGWGSDFSQQATIPADVRSANVSDIAAGDLHSCAVIAATGAVRCWGDNTFGQATPAPEAASGVKSIAAGAFGTLALLNTGGIAAWGDIGDLQLYASPAIPTITGATSISVGDSAAAVVLSDGSVFMWGINNYFQNLDGLFIPDVTAATSATVLAQTVVIRNGPLPAFTVGPTVAAPLPAAPPPPAPTPRVLSSAPISTGGSVVVWGDTGLQATGLNSSLGTVLPPLTSICSNNDYTLGLLPNGTVIFLMKGPGSGVTDIPPEAQSNVTRISCGLNHALVLKSNGTVKGFGSDADGIAVPAQLSRGGVTAISAGSTLSLAVQNGAVVAWPDGFLQLPASAGANIKDVAAGLIHGLALTNSGAVIGLPNPQGLVLDPSGLSEVPPAAATGAKAIAAGTVASLVLKNDGTVVAWGDKAFGAGVVPAGLRNVTAISTSEGYSAALQGDGRIATFGLLPFPNQIPAAAAGAAAIAPGPSHLLAVVGRLAPLGSAIPVLASPPPPVESATRDAAAPTSSDSKGGLSAGAIGGIVGGVVGGALLLLGLLLLALRKRKSGAAAGDIESQTAKDGMAKKLTALAVDDVMVVASPNDDVMDDDGQPAIKVAGLLPGDPFLKATSKQYRWADTPSGPEAVPVEAGITAEQLDQAAAGTGKPSPVQELTSSQVYDQLELLPDGLLGRGAAAYVFKARWPSRFGPNGLVAVKLLKDAYRCDQSILMSFNHEARLLESVRHPNVVRLYGYCLDPPCVCLILELLPHNLNDRLYPGKAATGTSQFAKMGSTNGYGETGMGAPSPSALLSPGSEASFSDFTTTGAGSLDTHSTSTNMPTTTTGYTNMSSDSSMPMSQVVPTPTGHGGPKAPPLSMLEVLLFSWDIAAGLSYLHDRNEVTRQAAAITDVAETTIAEEEGGESTHQPAQPTMGKIVHRDLKPANILFNSNWIAKISDFGLGREHENTTIHTEHVGAGTLAYMAPELLRGRRGGRSDKPTNRVDIYSLAIMMHEMVVRKKPWSNYSEMQMMVAVCNKQRPRMPMRPAIPDKLPDDLSATPARFELLPELMDLITACWHHRELKRPTATEVLDSLTLILRKSGVPDPATVSREALRLAGLAFQVVEEPEAAAGEGPDVPPAVDGVGDEDEDGGDGEEDDDLQMYAKHG